ncbi:hypothetical protein MBANPS3_012386 [Mucor bainieri]
MPDGRRYLHERLGYNGPDRTVPALKAKWRRMRNVKKPTGRASPTFLAYHIMKADDAMTEKACSEEVGSSEADTDEEEDEAMEDEETSGSPFGDLNLPPPG